VKSGGDATFPVYRDHVTRLSPFTNYTFFVRAGNTVNDVIAWGDWSSGTSVITATARKLDLTDQYVFLDSPGTVCCRNGWLGSVVVRTSDL